MNDPGLRLERDLEDQGFSLRQTHISRVFLSETSVYKVKKPVQLGFLDFSTLELRRRFCEAEVALNRRLAPATYRGVVPIVRDAQGVHRIAAAGEAVEWAVEMKRLPDRESGEQRLLDGRLEPEHLQLLAARLATFHAAARHDAQTAEFGRPETIERNVRENFEQTRQTAAHSLDAAELSALERWQLGFLSRQRELFSSRIEHGRIRDGHGDLRLEHCYFDDAGGVEIIDCIEFNDRFRYADVCADIAFLSMDLSWHGRHDLSEAFLGAYAQAAADYDLYALVDFYASYRAYVRGKVSALLANDASAPADVRARAEAATRKYYLLSEACTRPPLARPVLYAVGGWIAAGKSTLAQRMATLVRAPVVVADHTRKQLLGTAPETKLHEPAFAGPYDASTTARVYAELLRRAEIVLRSGRPVILDASFRERGQRQAALGLAQRVGVAFKFVECVAPLDLIRARLRTRETSASVSDGRLEILDAFVESYQPVDELPASTHLRLDTSRPESDSSAELRAWLG